MKLKDYCQMVGGQREAARKIGVHHQTLFRWFHHNTKKPHGLTAKRLKELGIEL